VSWSLKPLVGSVSATGLYTAPATITTTQTVQVIATSAADSTKSGAGTVTLTPPATATVIVSPSTASLVGGQSQQFTATVSVGGARASLSGVTWSINPTVGSISATGLYTAPATVTSAQTVQVTATSTADRTEFAVATVSLNPGTKPGLYAVAYKWISATQIRVSWTAPSSHSTYDTVTLSGYGSPDWWYVWQGQTGKAANGSFTITAPTAPGIYQFRYNSAKKNGTAVSAELPINVNQFSVSMASAIVNVGSPLTITWTAPAGRPTDWSDIVGVYAPGATNGQPLAYAYTRGATSGTTTLTSPATPGTYELRYVMDNLAGAISSPISVK
jgi:hypothetical protein